VTVTHLPAHAEQLLSEESFHLVLLDMNFTIDTSGRQGLKLLSSITANYKQLPVILMTGWATLQLAVEGMKAGAKDFLAKPWDNKHLLTSIETLISLVNDDRQKTSDIANHIVGTSAAFEEVMNIVNRVAHTDATVLITGESGTGKELIAEAIHQRSKRNGAAFVRVNLGGISTSLFESEMFGHKKGAFTDAAVDRIGRFELAEGGTIFLDELAELGLESQVKLLRVLQERTYEVLGSSKTFKMNVRIISATNKDLAAAIANGKFREDLYYRVNLITIHLPSLSQRREDIPALTKYFVEKTKMLYGVEPALISDEAIDWLCIQEYPGNIRQLKNLIERTLLLHLDRKELYPKDFSKSLEQLAMDTTKIALPKVGSISLEEMEISMIKKALNFYNHSISATAQSLGLTRSSLYRRLEKYHIAYEPKI
jgi:DNA-binding NtrC family response regulator